MSENSAIQTTMESIKELRESLVALDKERCSGVENEASSTRVQKALLKLRRSHSKMRDSQAAGQKRVVDAVKKLRKAQLELDNSRFLESQCDFLVEKYNSAHFPAFEKVSASLPSVADYSEKHKNDPDFVSQESDPHQFMMNMLASELEDRNRMEEEIVTLQQREIEIKRDMNHKREYLSSMAAKLQEVRVCVDGLAKLLAPE